MGWSVLSRVLESLIDLPIRVGSMVLWYVMRGSLWTLVTSARDSVSGSSSKGKGRLSGGLGLIG